MVELLLEYCVVVEFCYFYDMVYVEIVEVVGCLLEIVKMWMFYVWWCLC